METTFTDDMKINPNRLEREWIRQPDLYAKWAEKCVDAIKRKDLQKVKLEVIYAKLDKYARENWESLGFDKKITEAAIESYVLSNREYQQAKSDMVDIEYEVNLYTAAKQGMEHRKAALQDLVKLHLSGYYSELTTTPDTVRDFTQTHLQGIERVRQASERKVR
jgi:hypothetical protein